jgi:hypothetical protein
LSLIAVAFSEKFAPDLSIIPGLKSPALMSPRLMNGAIASKTSSCVLASANLRARVESILPLDALQISFQSVISASLSKPLVP